MPLTKEEISKAVDRKVETIPCPEWGGDVCIRVMSGHERAAWEAEHVKNKHDTAALLLVYTLSDELGNPMYQPTEIGLLKAKSGPVLDYLFAHASKINKIREKDVAELKNV